jgi:serine/threonine protein kinase
MNMIPDFGLSTHFKPGEPMNRVVGSSYYVAPEVLLRRYSNSCDMWSLGVIAYMLLSGTPPFFGPTDILIKQRIIKGRYSFPAQTFRDVSDEAKNFIKSLICFDSSKRFTAAAAAESTWLSHNHSALTSTNGAPVSRSLT